jgi:hypothetical protein
MVAERDTYQRGQMKNGIAPFHRSPYTVRVSHIPCKDIQTGYYLFPERIYPSPVIEGIVVYECPYLVSLFDQGFGQVTPYKTVSTRDQHLLHASSSG